MREPVGRKMDKIGRSFQALLQDELSHLDIDRSFYPLLLIEEGSGITQQELSRKLLCDKVQVVRIVDYLSSNGYVERVLNMQDKRKNVLCITDKARIHLPEIKKAICKISEATFNGLTSEQIDKLYNMLDLMENNLLSQ